MFNKKFAPIVTYQSSLSSNFVLSETRTIFGIQIGMRSTGGAITVVQVRDGNGNALFNIGLSLAGSTAAKTNLVETPFIAENGLIITVISGAGAAAIPVTVWHSHSGT